MQRTKIACIVVAMIFLPTHFLWSRQDSTKSNLTTLEFGDKSAKDQWEFVDDGWKFVAKTNEQAGYLSLFKKESNYSPIHRSPTHLALWKEPLSDKFQMDVILRSTHEDYPHRDVVIFFGYQDPEQYYYVHLAKKMDDNANQIFIVNKSSRKKISTKTTDGVDWDSEWHHVRVLRDARSGSIEVYFDNLERPVMTASDKSFGQGRFGLGSFDDTADFQKVEIVQDLSNSKPPEKNENSK